MVNKPVHEHVTQVTFHIACVALKLTESVGVNSQLGSKSCHLAATGFSLLMSNFHGLQPSRNLRDSPGL